MRLFWSELAVRVLREHPVEAPAPHVGGGASLTSWLWDISETGCMLLIQDYVMVFLSAAQLCSSGSDGAGMLACWWSV